MLNNFFSNLTLEDVLRWTRTLIQFGAGTTFGAGLLSGEQWQTIIGIVLSVISFLWTLKANTVTNKVIELEKSEEVAKVVPSADASASVKEAASGATAKP